MNKDEALKLALEALKQIDEAMPFPVAKLAQAAIKEALTQPKQEPVAWIDKMVIDVPNQLFYTAPHTWIGLTLDERIELAQDVDWAAGAYCEYAEKIEAKLKEKNSG